MPQRLSEVRNIEIRHYGPDLVPDPDHTTFIRLHPSRHNDGASLSLNNDAEVDALIMALQLAKRKGDGDGAGRTDA